MLSPRAIVAQHKKAAEAAHLATNTRMFDPSKQEAPCLDTATGVEMSMMVLPNSRRQRYVGRQLNAIFPATGWPLEQVLVVFLRA